MDEPRKAGKSPDLKGFDERLNRARSAHTSSQQPRPRSSAFGIAFKIATDMVVGVAVGVGIGWLLDSWLSTKPWFLLVFFVLGSAAGMMNVIRTAKALNDNKL